MFQIDSVSTYGNTLSIDTDLRMVTLGEQCISDKCELDIINKLEFM